MKEMGVLLGVLGDGSPGFSEDIFRIISSRVGVGDLTSVLDRVARFPWFLSQVAGFGLNVILMARCE